LVGPGVSAETVFRLLVSLVARLSRRVGGVPGARVMFLSVSEEWSGLVSWA